jgi:aerobic carbon-monoxide dehydrogenase large subunit
VEDPRLLTGKGRFVDDLNAKGQAFMGLVLSPFAHAKIASIDFTKARASPDFIDALTGEDLLKAGVSTVNQNPWPPQRRAKRYHLAVGRVRFVGEPVAAILVKTKSSLEDLLEEVEVEYEPLPVVTTIEESKQKKQLLYDDWLDNISQEAEENEGNADQAIASAAHVVQVQEGIKRQVAAPIEPHAVLVSYDKIKDIFEVNSTVQSAHGLQNVLATELKLPRQKFHVRVMDVGGGFGSKGGPSYPWPFLACMFARKTGLPIKWTATRTEEFLQAAAGRDEYCDLTIGCDKNGKIIALKGTIDCDMGVSGTQTHMPSMTMWTMSGAYDIPNIDLKVRSYVTNKMPIGPVRGAGGPEGCYFIERAVEILAKKAGMDPFAFRLLNLPKQKEPGAKEGDGSLLDILERSAHYYDLLKWQSQLNSEFKQSRSMIVGGIGISVRGEEAEEEEDEKDWSSGAGSSSWQNSSNKGGSSWQNSPENQSRGGNWPTGGDSTGGQRNKDSSDRGPELEGGIGTFSFNTESAKAVLQINGDLLVYTGSSPQGQGEETTFAQLASEELGVDIDQIRVIWGDTWLIPFGVGTFGSRSGAIGGSAVVEACRKLKTKLLEKASESLGVRKSSLMLNPGPLILDTLKPEAFQITVRDLFEKLGVTELSSESRFTATSMSYSSGAHLCALTLDVESGMVKIWKYIIVEDCGRMINEAVVDGQLHGGVLHGIGGALLEELVYDSDGNLLSTNFSDYMIPTATESPNFEIFHKITPSTANLDGVKGVGESGTIGSYGAVLNALNDALSQAGHVEVNIAPALPDAVFLAKLVSA